MLYIYIYNRTVGRQNIIMLFSLSRSICHLLLVSINYYWCEVPEPILTRPISGTSFMIKTKCFRRHLDTLNQQFTIDCKNDSRKLSQTIQITHNIA